MQLAYNATTESLERDSGKMPLSLTILINMTLNKGYLNDYMENARCKGAIKRTCAARAEVRSAIYYLKGAACCSCAVTDGI